MNKSIILLSLLGATFFLFAEIHSAEIGVDGVEGDQETDSEDTYVDETSSDFDEDDSDWQVDEMAQYSRSGACGNSKCGKGKTCMKKCSHKCVDNVACDECTGRGDNYDNEVGELCNDNCNCAAKLTCDFTEDLNDKVKRCRKRKPWEKVPIGNPKCANR